MRLQEAPGGALRPQEAPGDLRKAPGGPKTPKEPQEGGAQLSYGTSACLLWPPASLWEPPGVCWGLLVLLGRLLEAPGAFWGALTLLGPLGSLLEPPRAS